jgi:hypothetical protein
MKLVDDVEAAVARAFERRAEDELDSPYAVIRDNLHEIGLMRDRGCRWPEIARELKDQGVLISHAALRSIYNRQMKVAAPHLAPAPKQEPTPASAPAPEPEPEGTPRPARAPEPAAAPAPARAPKRQQGGTKAAPFGETVASMLAEARANPTPRAESRDENGFLLPVPDDEL